MEAGLHLPVQLSFLGICFCSLIKPVFERFNLGFISWELNFSY